MARSMIALVFHKGFKRRVGKLKPNERKKLAERLELFARDPFAPELRNHALHEPYADFRSITISGDLRAHYRLLEQNVAFFTTLGTHSELYE